MGIGVILILGEGSGASELHPDLERGTQTRSALREMEGNLPQGRERGEPASGERGTSSGERWIEGNLLGGERGYCLRTGIQGTGSRSRERELSEGPGSG